jgi:hypothetical protein
VKAMEACIEHGYRSRAITCLQMTVVTVVMFS